VKPIEEACRDRNHIALFIATIGGVIASRDNGEPGATRAQNSVETPSFWKSADKSRPPNRRDGQVVLATDAGPPPAATIR
jgi:hypothetical protein